MIITKKKGYRGSDAVLNISPLSQRKQTNYILQQLNRNILIWLRPEQTEAEYQNENKNEDKVKVEAIP